MIEDEIHLIIGDSCDPARELDALVDQFRSGRDAADILHLLRSQEHDIVRIGAWIASEISFERYNTHPILDRLKELTKHDVPLIRLYAFNALFPSFDPLKKETRELIERMINDTNEGVRMTAEAASKSLGFR